MSGWLFNNTLYIHESDVAKSEHVEYMKEVLNRLTVSTAGFYKATNCDDFEISMQTGNASEFISLRIIDGRCYMGMFDNDTKTLSTSASFNKICGIKDEHINSYITKLAIAEHYYNKHGQMSAALRNPEMLKRWDGIIAQIEKDGWEKPTKITDILLEDGTNLSKMYWDTVKSGDSAIISRTLLKDFNKDMDER